MSLANDATITMPVAPVYQGCGYGGMGSMWGGDMMSWLILFLLFGCFGGYGFGGAGGFGGGFNTPNAQGTITRADLNEGFALQGLQNGQTSIKDAVTNGFHGVDTAVCQLGYQTQDCCCQTQRAVDGVNYNMATQAAGIQNAIQGINYNLATGTNSVIQNAHDDTSRVLAKLDAMEAARVFTGIIRNIQVGGTLMHPVLVNVDMDGLTITGNTYPVRQMMRDLGLAWDKECKAWTGSREALNALCVKYA